MTTIYPQKRIILRFCKKHDRIISLKEAARISYFTVQELVKEAKTGKLQSIRLFNNKLKESRYTTISELFRFLEKQDILLSKKSIDPSWVSQARSKGYIPVIDALTILDGEISESNLRNMIRRNKIESTKFVHPFLGKKVLVSIRAVKELAKQLRPEEFDKFLNLPS